MLQIRQSFFETNSSSVHALIISKTEGCRLPSTVNLSEDSDHGDIIRAWVRSLNNERAEKLINWLYSHGVDEIIYNGSNATIISCIKSCKLHPKDVNPEDIAYKFNDIALTNFICDNIHDEYEGHDDYLYCQLDTDEFTWYTTWSEH